MHRSCCYELDGKQLGKVGFTIEQLRVMSPFSSGNAMMGWHNGQMLCLFDVHWTSGNQGMEYIAVNTETMEASGYSTWEGSHSFGISMTETPYGFAAIQMGDANPRRGIIINTVCAW